MSELQPKSRIAQFLYDFDCRVNAGCYSVYDWLCRSYSAYSAVVSRWRISGPKRVLVDLTADGATLGLLFSLGLMYYALPPIFESDDIWDRGRQYSVTFTDSTGNVIGRRGIWQDDAIPLEEIPPHVIKAVLATEDQRFFEHFGVDIQGTTRAMVSNLRASTVVQGGSTITQQLAKNLFLTPERTLRRKMHEAFLAVWIEARLTKQEILKLYLDRSYLGGGTYGVEAAAQFYFAKSIRDVNLAEAAMLAGLFKAPSKYAPHANIENARNRAKVVLYRMLDAGAISQGQMFAARREPAQFVDRKGYYSPDYFLDWAYEQTLELLRKHRLETEYVVEVKSTINLDLQRHAQATINKMLDENTKKFRAKQAALVSMEPSGAVRSIVGGRDYDKSQFNRATEAKRQPGSSFKPFVYLTALASGMTPKTIVVDRPVRIGNWSPRNYNGRYRGRVSLTTALKKSINSIPVQIAQKVGTRKIIQVAHKVGLQSDLRPNPSMPLGTNEVTVMDLTAAYATFASGGRLARPYAVLEIARPNGEVLYNREQNAPRRRQVVNQSLISDLNYMLNQVVLSGTGRRAQLGFTPQAGKTGTTQGYRDAWFVGYTAHYVTGVWFGNDDYTPTRRLTGGNLPAMTWHAYMSKALETKVAAPLVGVPLDGQYAAYVDPDLSQVEPLFDDTIVDDELIIGSNDDGVTVDDDGDVTVQPRSRSEAVVSAFQNMFNLFNDNKAPKYKRRKKRRKDLNNPGSRESTSRRRKKRSGRFESESQ
ncbi:MAG: transglycosylase domain-containing protein [Hyphomicrobiales bacterium]